MATYSVDLYTGDPFFIFSRSVGGTATWTGTTTPNGTATITDTETGIEEFTLDDDNAGNESATANVTIGGNTSTGVNVDAEESWTLRDTVTGEIFQIITFEVEGGAADGYYTLSEMPLVAGRVYETLAFDNNPDATAGDPVFNATDYALNNEHIVEGSAGNDTIDGAYLGDPQGHQIDDGLAGGPSGNANMVMADDGDDLVQSGSGDDTVYGGTGADTLEGGADNDWLLGEAGADSLDGGAGDDTLEGGADGDTLRGGAGADSLEGGAGADSLDGGADGDTIRGGLGDDTIDGQDGADLIFGGLGADSILGGDGADTIQGDGDAPTEVLDWSLQGADGTDISAGFTQNTGLVDVSVGFANDGDNSPTFTVETTDTLFVDAGEEYDTNSSLFLFGDGDAATSTTTIDFAAATGAPVTDAVTNVSFRINDIDFGTGNHQDVVTVNAFDALGNPVTVTITPAGNDTVVGNTVTAGLTGESAADAAGSVLVEIAGPVSQIEIVYSNLLTGTQGVNVSDVYFDVIPSEAGSADSIDGGAGADSILGMAGDDTLRGGSGNDTLTGGSGDDVFAFDDGTGDDVITDFDIADDNSDGFYNDQLDVSGLTDAFGNPINAWDVTVENDGSGNTLLTFPSGDTLVLQGVAPTALNTAQLLNAAGVPCFNEGTYIRTPDGEVRIEDLQLGDLVCTQDGGAQPIRWIGSRQLGLKELQSDEGARPILIPEGILGNYAQLFVSPLHGVLLPASHLGEEVFARAKHLAEAEGPVRIAHGKRRVAYYHLLLDSHQILFANGAACESFYPGEEALKMLAPAQLRKIHTALPALAKQSAAQCYGPTARPFARRKDVLKHVRLYAKRCALSIAAE